MSPMHMVMQVTGKKQVCKLFAVGILILTIVCWSLESYVYSSILDRLSQYENVYNPGGCHDLLLSKFIFKHRDDLGAILQKLGFTVGAELGVQQGFFAETTLRQWPRAKTYLLVDVWAEQDKYSDSANVNKDKQNNYYEQTKRRMSPFIANGVDVQICRNFTSICVKQYPAHYFDYIYVDARHDFKSVYMDLVDWWPKLKPNGIFAGHDYVSQNEGPQQSGQDWTINFDGTIDTTGTVVKGAVNKFAAEQNVTVHVSQEAWPTWAIVKPMIH